MNTNHGSVLGGRIAALLGAALLVGTLPALALAAPYLPCGAVGRGGCIGPAPGPHIPRPVQVGGKEHSAGPDRHTGNSPPAPAPMCPPDSGRNVAWDGLGGTDNSFDYAPADLFEADAMANLGDALYDDVVADRAALLFAVDASPDIYVEPSGPTGGAPAGRVWALGPVEVEGMCPGTDLDGLEVWGEDTLPTSDDANRYSKMGDPFDPALPPGGGRTSVHAHPGATPLCATATLASSMAMLFALSPVQEMFLRDFMDVDALMISGGSTQGPDDDPAAGSGPTKMMWSVRPIMIPMDGPFPPVTLDGGEIFVGDCTGGPAFFLPHGGHIWDTTFPVMATFGLPSENVSALEAVAMQRQVPSLSPGGLALLAAIVAGSAAFGLRRWRRSSS